MSFRGINTTVIQIRRQVFTEVARMAYANVKGEQANHLMRKIPYTIIPGEEGKLRKDIFLERAIVEERVRLAMGLPTRRMDEHNSVVSGLEDASIADKYYDPPLVNVIKFACNRCPEKLVKVSDLCQGCLAHPCMEVCPKKAITWESGRSTIDQEKCIGNMHVGPGKEVTGDVHVYMDEKDKEDLRAIRAKGVDVYIQIAPGDHKLDFEK